VYKLSQFHKRASIFVQDKKPIVEIKAGDRFMDGWLWVKALTDAEIVTASQLQLIPNAAPNGITVSISAKCGQDTRELVFALKTLADFRKIERLARKDEQISIPINGDYEQVTLLTDIQIQDQNNVSFQVQDQSGQKYQVYTDTDESDYEVCPI
jgi:hypothetical protein